MARKRASMREGPLAELFRRTEAAQRAQEEAASEGAAPAEDATEKAADPRAEAAPPLDQMLAFQFAERAANGHARHAMRRRQIVFIGKPRAESHRAADDAVAQHQINPACLGFLQPIRHLTPASFARQAAGTPLY